MRPVRLTALRSIMSIVAAAYCRDRVCIDIRALPRMAAAGPDLRVVKVSFEKAKIDHKSGSSMLGNEARRGVAVVAGDRYQRGQRGTLSRGEQNGERMGGMSMSITQRDLGGRKSRDAV